MWNYTVSEQISMETLLWESAEVALPKIWALIAWVILVKNKSQIIVDVDWANIWIISWRELNDSFNTAKELKIWDKINAVVLEDENEDWVLILSVRKAWQFNTWDRLKDARKVWTIVSVVPTQANKWWLLVDLDWIKAFIPVSQLAPEHYPRVENSDINKILSKLQKLVWVNLSVCVINIDETTWKMILSEKEARKWDQDQTLKWLDIGSVISGKVTWVSKFWFFVTFWDLEWLVHISEIAWGHVSDPQKYAKVWDTIDVKVIWIEWNKISLSLKRMHDDPWITLTQKYKVWDMVKWIVNKVSEFWAFVSLEEDVNWLIHLSEIEDGTTDARSYFSVGQDIEAKIIEINPDEHRIALSVKWIMGGKKKDKAKKADDKAEEVSEDAKHKKWKAAKVEEKVEESKIEENNEVVDKKSSKKVEKVEEKKKTEVKKEIKKETKKVEKKEDKPAKEVKPKVEKKVVAKKPAAKKAPAKKPAAKKAK